MTTTLRVVLDAAPVRPGFAGAAQSLAAALAETVPAGCAVETVLAARARDVVPGGMVHSPSLLAPLVRHERHNGDQTVVTVWDLRPWEAPGELPRAVASIERRRLRLAVRHADAVIVPTHAMAERLAQHARFGDRIRVIAGAQPDGFVVPTDAEARRRDLRLPEGYVVLSGGAGASDALAVGFRAAAAVARPVVVLDVPAGEDEAVRAIAAAAGLDPARVHPHPVLDRGDRATVLDAAAVCLAPSKRGAWPWRAVEAMALGTPLVALDSDVHREVVLDGGLVVSETLLPAALAEAVGGGHDSARLRVLGRDRSRAFSWAGAAERVWQLHADL